MSERENFEEAASRLGFNLTMAEHETGEYHYQVTQDAWDIWQEATYSAAREQEGGEAVAHRVTGAYTDQPFKDKSSADAYCRGLLTSHPDGGYKVTPLYTHPPQSQSVPEEYRQALQDACDIIQADANTEENYGSLCRIGSVLGKLSTPAEATTDGVFTPCDRYKVPDLTDGQTVICLEDGEQRRFEFCQAEDGEYWWRDAGGKLADPSHYSLWGIPFPDAAFSAPAAPQSQGVPEGQIVDCPYACGWQNLQSIITRNAAYFARETIDDDFPEEIRQSGIASGQYALELCRFARRLSTPAAPQADAYAVIEPSGDINYAVRVQDDEGFPPGQADDIARTFCHDHINDAAGRGVEGAGQWVVRPLTIGGLTRPQPPEQGDGV